MSKTISDEAWERIWETLHWYVSNSTFNDKAIDCIEVLKKSLEAEEEEENCMAFTPLRDEDIVNKLESLKNENSVTCGSTEGAREHLKSMMKAPEKGEWEKPNYVKIADAIACGYCHKKNSHKVLDADLIEAMAEEVTRLLEGGK